MRYLAARKPLLRLAVIAAPALCGSWLWAERRRSRCVTEATYHLTRALEALDRVGDSEKEAAVGRPKINVPLPDGRPAPLAMTAEEFARDRRRLAAKWHVRAWYDIEMAAWQIDDARHHWRRPPDEPSLEPVE